MSNEESERFNAAAAGLRYQYEIESSQPCNRYRPKLFIDCEWNGFGGQLISIALTAGNRINEFYEVLTLPERIDPWVSEHVIPKLDKQPIDYKEMQLKLGYFLSMFDSVHIVADWPEDIERLCQALITGAGTRINTPPLTMEVVRVNTLPVNPHNALSDARALADHFLAAKKACSVDQIKSAARYCDQFKAELREPTLQELQGLVISLEEYIQQEEIKLQDQKIRNMKIINSAIENHPDNKHEVFQLSNAYDYGAVLSSIKAAGIQQT